ncbi:MAG: 30S ribosomal protein S4 [Candidatus Nanoarchaeia archaeon]
MWRQKKTYSGPKHPWKKERIEEEHNLAKEYGIRRMREIWKMRAILRNWQRQAKEIIGMRPGPKKDAAQKILMDKLQKFGVVTAEADLDDVLSLQLKDILNKRLETVVFKKGLALTPMQARQFIVHGKIMVNGKKLNAPSYLVKVNDDISFVPGFVPKLKPEEASAQIKALAPTGESEALESTKSKAEEAKVQNG